VSVPLLFRDSIIGVLNLAKGTGASPFTESDVELVTVLAGQAAAAIENARLFERTQQSFEQLAELEHLKSEFISIAAHELRTPLAIIVAYVTLVAETSEGSAKEHLGVALEASGQLQSLIDVMVDLSHLESGALVLQPDEVRLRDVVDLALEETRPLLEEQGHTFSLDIPDDLPVLVADKRKLTVVLSSLLSNAAKFTQPGGRIGVAAQVEDGTLVVSVTDNGRGISEEDQQRIFDRFYQVESSLSREHGGLGLGLSIAKGIVELHGGFIWVDSQPEQGSTFLFTIPLIQSG
jgi:signal transduction histidine kinase